MTLDRRKAYEIAQALLGARNKYDKGEVIQAAAHDGVAPGEGGYREPRLERLSSQSHQLIPAPPSAPFRDSPQLADLQNIFGQPSEVNAAYRIEHTPIGGYTPRKVYGLNKYQAPYSAGERAAETGIYQNLRNDLGIQPHISGRQSLKHGRTAPPLPGHSNTTSRQADDGLGKPKQTQGQESELPKVRYPTAGVIVSEFLGGIGKGIVQTLAEMGTNETERRLAEVNGIHVDIPTPDLFGRPISPWDNNGRAIAPGLSVAVMPYMRGAKGIRRGKRIGRITPPTHLRPGTTPYGNYMHAEIVKLVQKEYPLTQFHTRVGQGQRGIDMSPSGGQVPDFHHLDIKTNKRHSEKEIKRQIQNWGYDESTVKVLTYDEFGNVYEGFDY